MSERGLLRSVLVRTVSPLLKRWYGWWNRTERRVRVDGFDLVVLPGVFHPALFNSTHLLAAHVSSLPLEGRTFLDLGTGAGRIALTAARRNALVTACDLNPTAVDCARISAERNRLPINCVVSDQFDALSGHFDFIAINPPYYPKDPTTVAEHAFFTGEGHRYFTRLFPALASRIANGSTVFMVLSKDLDLAVIRGMAAGCDLALHPIRSAVRFGETTTVFAVRRGALDL